MPSLLQAQHSKNSAVIFMYHKFDVSKYPSTNITLEQFESHLNEFNSNQYNILPLGVILNTIINDHKLPPNTIGITVDDANRSFLTTAWPRFKELNMPVTLFVSTKTIAPGNKNYLNWDEIRLLKKQGVTIILTTHNLFEAQEMCDRIAILNKGNLVALDTTKNLLKKIETKKITFKVDKLFDFSQKKIDGLVFSSILSNEIIVTYEKNKHKIEDIIGIIKNEGAEIIDISTNDGNLEDVFIQLTKN